MPPIARGAVRCYNGDIPNTPKEEAMLKKLGELFVSFARIGVLTIGGGYAMLPMMQNELVERRGWATEEEMMDYYALARSP